MSRKSQWTATELMTHDFPEPKWAVPELIPEGLTLLVAAPKFGKSWAMLSLGISIALGGKAFGHINVDQGDCLLLALEDTPRRLQDRLAILLRNDQVPERLHIWTELESLEQIEEWCEEHPKRRYIGVDVLRKVRATAFRGESAYDNDYRSLEPFKDLADQYNVGVVVSHHDRKATSDDFVDSVSGTNGLAGAADTVIVMQRARNNENAVLHITGRDVDEDERALRFDGKTCQWELLPGPAVLHIVADTRRLMLEALRLNPAGLRPIDASRITGIKPDLARQTLRRMYEAGQLNRVEYGRYVSPSQLSLCHENNGSQVTP